METLDNNMESGEGLVINGDIRAYLMETAKWGRFLAIVGFVGMGIDDNIHDFWASIF